MTKFIPMNSFGEELVDCRSVQIVGHYSRATMEQVKSLAEQLVNMAEELFEGVFTMQWLLNGKRVKENALRSKIKSVDAVSGFEATGYMGSPRKITGKNIEIIHNRLFMPNPDAFPEKLSADYWAVFCELFSQGQDVVHLRENLLKLFRMENRTYMHQWQEEDVVVTLSNTSYFDTPRKELHYGDFHLAIALPCIGDSATTFAERAVTLLNQTIQIVPDISGHVLLEPYNPPDYCEVHTAYFGGGPCYLPLGKPSYMRQRHWERLYFLRGVEWYNLLSPIQTEKLKDRVRPKGVLVEQLPNGGSSVTTEKNILETQVTDLCAIKQFLYPILYPGGRTILLSDFFNKKLTNRITKLRCMWENIPVLEREIEVFPDRIVLAYQPNNMEANENIYL